MTSSAAAEKPAPKTPFDRIGGKEVVRTLVNRFYDLMEGDPAYAQLRALHAPDLVPMRESLTGFLTAWMGGPRDWFTERPGACVMSAHKPFAIDATLRDQWLDAMRRAANDVLADDGEFVAAMMDAFTGMAEGMRNR